MRSPLTDAVRAESLALLSMAERQRYDSTAAHRREAFIAGRWMLRQLASELLGIAPDRVHLTAPCPDCGREHGKPHVVGSRLQLALTHGADVVVAAASWDAAVGIDIEPLDQPAAALAAIGVLAGEDSLLRWTRIEAILKADGRGLRVDPAQVALTPVANDDGDGTGSWLEGTVTGSPTRYRVSEVELTVGVRVSIAVAQPN
jgi:4'-phosphopantetheinyl transferase